MKFWSLLISAALICTSTLRVAAQEPTSSDPRPFEFSWPRETALLVTGVTGQIIGQYRVSHMAPARPEELRRADLSGLDRWAAGTWNPGADLASDVVTLGVSGSMIGADLWHLARGNITRDPLLEDALILAQAAAWNSAINLNIRATRVHPRPFVYDNTPTNAQRQEAREGQAAGSFYSGHASAAFLGAVYVATVYPLRHPEFEQRGWLWAGSLTAATGAAALRVAAGKHFPSDVIAGAAMGSLMGLGFAQLHLKGGEGFWGWNTTPWINSDGQPGLMAVRRL